MNLQLLQNYQQAAGYPDSALMPNQGPNLVDQNTAGLREEIMNERKNKFLKIGRNDGFMTSTEDLSALTIKKNNFDKILKSKKVLSAIVGGLILISLILLFI